MNLDGVIEGAPIHAAAVSSTATKHAPRSIHPFGRMLPALMTS